jgi:hypothetical protein
MTQKDEALQLVRDTIDGKIDIHGLQPDTWPDVVKKDTVGYLFYMTTDNRFFVIRAFKDRIIEFCGLYHCASIFTTPLVILEKIHQHRQITHVTKHELKDLIHPDTLNQFCTMLRTAPTYHHALDNSVSDIRRKCWPPESTEEPRVAAVG